MEWEVVIGLEVHAQLLSKSKIFSGASTAFGAAPNTQAALIDLGYPGVLPVLNEEAVRMAVKFGLAIGAEIAPRSVFARKNYFYPDLPKGYQISQYELPVLKGGSIEITLEDGACKRVPLTRAHLEEDAGKSLHEDLHGLSGIDLNRAGTPLLEIVSEPELRSAKEAVAYLKTLRTLVRYLEICDGNMQEGSLRCDANVSLRRRGSDRLGTRTETKNLNSFRFVEKAINYEIERQRDVLEGGGKVVQETRLYDSDRDETRSMRSKEEANDYRYFPIRTCCLSRSMPHSSTRRGGRCRSCRTRVAIAWSVSTGCRATTPACSLRAESSRTTTSQSCASSAAMRRPLRTG
jgi:aspartyl-tRNA(Asn)/glutamyl-tRNA(Gln) amidotransferase subunit B